MACTDDQFNFPHPLCKLTRHPNIIFLTSTFSVVRVDEPINIHNTKVRVERNGHVTWVTQKRLSVTCSTNPDEDEPSCELKFHSWTYGKDRLELTADKDRIDAG